MTVLRNTQHVVQVAEQYDAKLRMTMQYVQVLYTESSGPADQYIEDTGLQSMTDGATVATILNVVASDTISLSDDASNFINARIGNTLSLSDSATVMLVLTRSTEQLILVSDDVSLLSDQSHPVLDTLSVTDTVSVIRLIETQVVEDTLSLSDTAVQARPVASTLTLSDVAVGVIGGIPDSASDIISITDTATVELTISLTASNTLALTHSPTGNWIVEGATDISAVLELQDFAVGTTVENYVLLFAPYPQVAAAIVLPRPLLQDKENSAATAQIRRAMDGTRYSYVKNPRSRVLSYTFEMTRQKSLELENFIDNYNGEHIKLQNWKGEIWDVQLLTNPVDYTQNRRSAPVGQTGVNLQFEGVKLSG